MRKRPGQVEYTSVTGAAKSQHVIYLSEVGPNVRTIS